MSKAYLYVLQSQKTLRKYVGVTYNIDQRLERHNSGRVAITKKDLPYQVVYSEAFDDLSLARRRENFLKSGDGRRVLQMKLSAFW